MLNIGAQIKSGQNQIFYSETENLKLGLTDGQDALSILSCPNRCWKNIICTVIHSQLLYCNVQALLYLCFGVFVLYVFVYLCIYISVHLCICVLMYLHAVFVTTESCIVVSRHDLSPPSSLICLKSSLLSQSLIVPRASHCC